MVQVYPHSLSPVFVQTWIYNTWRCFHTNFSLSGQLSFFKVYSNISQYLLITTKIYLLMFYYIPWNHDLHKPKSFIPDKFQSFYMYSWCFWAIFSRLFFFKTCHFPYMLPYPHPGIIIWTNLNVLYLMVMLHHKFQSFLSIDFYNETFKGCFSIFFLFLKNFTPSLLLYSCLGIQKQTKIYISEDASIQVLVFLA